MTGTLNITSEELEKYIRKRKQDSEQLYNFINQKVHPKIRNKLLQLIEKYNNYYSDQNCCENKLYYKAGFSDGAKMLLTIQNYKGGVSMENFISVLLKNREENDAFNIEDEELKKWQEKLDKSKQELHNLAYEKLDEKCLARFDHLALEIEEIIRNIFDIRKQLYFEVGIKEGTKISKTLKQE